jgi:hypothetical protein
MVKLFNESSAPTNSMGLSSTVHGTGAIDTFDPALKPKKPSLFGTTKQQKQRSLKKLQKSFREVTEGLEGAGSSGSSYASSQVVDTIKGSVVRRRKLSKNSTANESANDNDQPNTRYHLAFSGGKFKIEKTIPPEKRVKLGRSTPLIINPNMHDTMNKVGDAKRQFQRAPYQQAKATRARTWLQSAWPEASRP